MLDLSGLSRSFRGVQALRRVDLSIPRGTSLGLIGPNGAGKSTLIRLVAGLLTPDTGRVHLAGRDLTEWSPERRVRHGLAWSYQHVRHFDSLTVRQHLELAARCAGGRHHAAESVDEWLHELELHPWRDHPVTALSMARRKLLDVARAACAGPLLLLLDEPLAGLSRRQGELLARRIAPLRQRGMTLLIVEHRIPELLTLVDEVAVLARGTILHRGPPRATIEEPEVLHAYFGVDATGGADG